MPISSPVKFYQASRTLLSFIISMMQGIRKTSRSFSVLATVFRRQHILSFSGGFKERTFLTLQRKEPEGDYKLPSMVGVRKSL